MINKNIKKGLLYSLLLFFTLLNGEKVLSQQSSPNYYHSEPNVFRTTVKGLGDILTIFIKEHSSKPETPSILNRIVMYQSILINQEGMSKIDPQLVGPLADWRKTPISIRDCSNFVIGTIADKFSFRIACTTKTGVHKFGHIPLLGKLTNPFNQVVDWDQENDLIEKPAFKSYISNNAVDIADFNNGILKLQFKNSSGFAYSTYAGKDNFGFLSRANRFCADAVQFEHKYYLFCNQEHLIIFNANHNIEKGQILNNFYYNVDVVTKTVNPLKKQLLADLNVYKDNNQNINALVTSVNIEPGPPAREVIKIAHIYVGSFPPNWDNTYPTQTIVSPIPVNKIEKIKALRNTQAVNQPSFDLIFYYKDNLNSKMLVYDNVRPLVSNLSQITPRIVDLDLISPLNTPSDNMFSCISNPVFVGNLFNTGCIDPRKPTFRALWNMGYYDGIKLRTIVGTVNPGDDQNDLSKFKAFITPLSYLNPINGQRPLYKIFKYYDDYIFIENNTELR